MANGFEEVKILDNFYQTSSFFPMPVVLVETYRVGHTNLGPYSLCFPHIVASRHSMMLIARDTSNTARFIQERKHCALNFIPHTRRFMKNCVTLGFPGETTEEKMKNSIFTLEPSRRLPQWKAPASPRSCARPSRCSSARRTSPFPSRTSRATRRGALSCASRRSSCGPR